MVSHTGTVLVKSGAFLHVSTSLHVPEMPYAALHPKETHLPAISRTGNGWGGVLRPNLPDSYKISGNVSLSVIAYPRGVDSKTKPVSQGRFQLERCLGNDKDINTVASTKPASDSVPAGEANSTVRRHA
ncbi:hypothetical protein JZ751_003225 [Albula glossodonta]|uniref:Uncharacterized protein n=1 Tax=Albula glossodonta TaxID=121402 RepID=A0A8T2NKD5_9TELE|nr:hypothetical protein JZ751_003225 [Albula glossodonta]